MINPLRQNWLISIGDTMNNSFSINFLRSIFHFADIFSIRKSLGCVILSKLQNIEESSDTSEG